MKNLFTYHSDRDMSVVTKDSQCSSLCSTVRIINTFVMSFKEKRLDSFFTSVENQNGCDADTQCC